MVRAHIFYSGTVQGVGFRYMVQRHARTLDLKGWVRNLSDGRVEMMIEGSEEKIEELCKAIEGHFGDYIRGTEQEFKENPHEFKDFQIRI